VDRKARAEGRPQDATPEVASVDFWGREEDLRRDKVACQVELLKEAAHHFRAKLRIFIQCDHPAASPGHFSFSFLR